MLTAMFDFLMEVSPAARQRILRFWYQLLSRLDTAGVMLFMNYGYADLDGAPALELCAEDEPNRYCIQLYHHVAAAIDLHSRDVLEIGCGRGGGAAFVSRCLGPATVTGVDYSDRAIRFCVARHRSSGVRFVPGDAEHLPFGPATFDVVVNIESSHCYPSMVQFLSEVTRVLRPGGYLLYADFRNRGEINQWRAQFASAGLRVESEHNITRNVVRALDLDHDRRQTLIQAHAPHLLHARLGRFAGLRGSPIYMSFDTGRQEYWSFVLRNGDS